MNALETLKSLVKRGNVRVIGRTSYRTARVNDVIMECDRHDVSFLEDLILDKDNHVVVIFQVLWGENGWTQGLYYAFLYDMYCLIGKEIVMGDF